MNPPPSNAAEPYRPETQGHTNRMPDLWDRRRTCVWAAETGFVGPPAPASKAQGENDQSFGNDSARGPAVPELPDGTGFDRLTGRGSPWPDMIREKTSNHMGVFAWPCSTTARDAPAMNERDISDQRQSFKQGN